MKKLESLKIFFALALICFSFIGKMNAQTWEIVSIDELTADDVFVIVDIHSGRAMSNNNGASAAPTAVAITLNGDSTQLVGEVANNLKWNITGNATDGYTFHVANSSSLLYCNNSNNGVRVGTSTSNNTFTINSGYLYNVGRARYLGVYNDADWRCYTSIHNNIKDTKVRFFRYTENQSTVATPTFTPGSGRYYTDQMVQIACADASAVIYYTTDGTRPNGTSAVYSAPIVINSTTTLKAIAVVGTDTSNVATANYTLPMNIATVAELRNAAADNSTLYRLQSACTISYTGSTRNQKYMQDATGGIMVDDANGIITSTYVQGDVMSDLVGTLTVYNKMLEFVPAVDPGEATVHGQVVEPIEVAIASIDSTYESRLVLVKNVTFAAEGTFAAGVDNVLNESETVNVRVRYAESDLVGTDIPTTAQDITGVIYRFNSDYNLVPRSLTDLTEHTETPVECDEAPAFNSCTAVLNADNNIVLTASLSSVGGDGCHVREYGFIYGPSSFLYDEESTQVVEFTNTINANEEFTTELAIRSYDPYYVRAYAQNERNVIYSDLVMIQPAEPAQYTVTFVVDGYATPTDVITFNEGDQPLILEPLADCDNTTFVGWTLTPLQGTTTVRPEFITEFTPTSDITFHAVFSKTTDNFNDRIVISRDNFAETVTAYGTADDWHATSEMLGTEVDGVADLYNTDAYMQMRNSSEPHPSNTTALPGRITDITIYGSSNITTARGWTPYLSATALNKNNYENGGTKLEKITLAASSAISWHVADSIDAQYFYLSLSGGASYVDSIVVDFGSSTTVYTRSAIDTVEVNATICEGMTYTDEHFNTNEAGIHTQLETADSYCGTYYILNLATHTPDTIFHAVDTCDAYTVDGVTYTTDQVFTLETPSEETYGCPIYNTWDIHIRATSSNEITENACISYTWNDVTYTISGDYEQTFTNAAGCDSTVTLHLTIFNGNHTTETETVCGTNYTWERNGVTYVQSGEYDIYEENAQGCEDTVTLLLTINRPDTVVFNGNICEGGVYNLNGFNETEAGEHVQHLTNQAGCDSTVILNLAVGSAFINEITDEICANTDYNANGFVISGLAAGTYEYSDTFPRVGTCDSIVVLTLTVKATVATEISETACDSYTWNDSTYTRTGVYQQSFTAENGCDSTVTLNLTINHSVATSEDITICDSDLPYTYNDTVFEIGTPQFSTFNFQFSTQNGCDSVVTLNLTVNPTDNVEFEVSTQEPYTWNDSTYEISGDYTQHFTNANGCDSTVTLHLTITHDYTVTFNVNGDLTYEPAQTFNTGNESMELPILGECGNFRFMGWSTTQSPAGLVTHTFTPQSDITLYAIFSHTLGFDTITINRSSFGALTGYGTIDPWTVTSANGLTISGNADLFNATSDYMQMRATTAPHPYNTVALPGRIISISIVGAGTGTARPWTPYVANVPLNETNFEAEGTELATQTASSNDGEIIWNIANPGKYFYLKLGGGATYIDHITVTFNASEVTYTTQTTDTVVTDATICSGDSHVDNYFNESEEGTYETTINSEGSYCSTVYILNLTVNQPVTNTISETACETFTWNNETYTQSGEYTQTFTAANGCDSIVTLNLTVNQPVTNTISETACETFTWNNETHTQSGEYTQYLTAANGCDSTVTLNLTINHSVADTVNETVCDSYEWNGVTHTESGNYTWTGQTIHGCDSVIVLNLTINESVTEEVTETANGSFEWHGETYTESGDYTWAGTTAEGCDSTVTLHLTITTGIANYDGLSLKVWPNPTSTVLNVECGLADGELQLFDAMGRQVLAQKTDGNITTMNVSTLAPGVYVLHVVGNGKTMGMAKVVVR